MGNLPFLKTFIDFFFFPLKNFDLTYTFLSLPILVIICYAVSEFVIKILSLMLGFKFRDRRRQ